MQEYYWDVNNRTRMGRYLTAVETDFINACLQHEPTVHSILDVGGGSGRFAIPLEKKGYRVVVTEVAALPLRWLKIRHPAAQAVLTSRDAIAWPIRAASVDWVLAIEIPLVERPWFWQECYRVLRPGGCVITVATNRDSYKGALYTIRPLLNRFLSSPEGKTWALRRDFYGQSAQALVRLLEAHRFRLEQALGFNWLPAGRRSELPLIPMLAALERALGLRRLAFYSPWVIFKACAC